MASCSRCGKDVYATGHCSGCAWLEADCQCVTPRQKAAAKRTRKAKEMSVWERMPIELRAGTPVEQRYAIPIFGTSKRGKMRHGTLLRNLRIYQCGGEIDNFVYWKKHAVSIAMDVWQQLINGVERDGIRYGVDVIEVVDHRRNRVWRCDFRTMLEHGEPYDAGIGPRWCVPLGAGLWEQGELPPKKGAPLDPTHVPASANPRLI